MGWVYIALLEINATGGRAENRVLVYIQTSVRDQDIGKDIGRDMRRTLGGTCEGHWEGQTRPHVLTEPHSGRWPRTTTTIRVWTNLMDDCACTTMHARCARMHIYAVEDGAAHIATFASPATLQGQPPPPSKTGEPIVLCPVRSPQTVVPSAVRTAHGALRRAPKTVLRGWP